MTRTPAHVLTSRSWNDRGTVFTVTITHSPSADMRRGTPAAMATRALHREEHRTGLRAVASRVTYSTHPNGAVSASTYTFRFPHPGDRYCPGCNAEPGEPCRAACLSGVTQ